MIESKVAESRFNYLDNIRSITIVFVVLFHSILSYALICPWWYVIDSPPIPNSIYFILLLDTTMMPVLFFISGLFAWPSYERKGTYHFMTGKLKRLIIPFLLCTFLFSPIMPFIRQSLRAMSSGEEAPGFLSFWIDFFKNSFTVQSGAVGTSTEIAVNQYWFLMLLFLFFAGFSLYAWLRGRTRKIKQAIFSRGPKSRTEWLGVITAFSLVLALIYAIICTFMDGTTWVTLGGLWQLQPAKVHIYLGLFLAGIYVERRKLLPVILDIAHPVVWLIVAILFTTTYFITVMKTMGVSDPSLFLVIASRLLRLFVLVSVLLWLLTFFNRRVNKSTLIWRELSSNSYNIYLIHMPPLVVIQLLALSWPVTSLFKFFGVSLLTLVFSYLVSRFLVKKYPAVTVVLLFILFICMSLLFK
jgi:surface polysaccharide O-acyltransferase-like enzyme